MAFPNIKWTWSFPHVAEVAAHGGGTWRLIIEPRSGNAGYGWRVAHSGTGRGSRAGSASSANFAKAQAELATAELEGAASSSIGAG